MGVTLNPEANLKKQGSYRQQFFKIRVYTRVMENETMERIERLLGHGTVTRSRIGRFLGGAAVALTVVATGTLAWAAVLPPLSAGAPVVIIGRQDGTTAPPPDGANPPPDGGGRGRPGGRRPMPPISVATMPLEVMDGYLTLTADQKTKIAAIDATLREQMRPPRPANDEDSAAPPAPPTAEEREAHRKTVDAAVATASDSVTALLTDAQKAKLPVLLKAFAALRAGRVPPPAVASLKLTDAQWTQLSALGKGATRATVGALLTDTQKAALAAARPPRGRRPGPPPGGEGGGPPPPPDEGGGPPPPPGEGGGPPPPPPGI